MRWDWSKLQPFVVAVKTACDHGALGGAKAIQNDIRMHFSKTGRYKSGPVGSPPNIRRARLRNSIEVELAGPMQARIGSNLKYAHVHEFGKHIAALGRNLTIPLNEPAARLSERFSTSEGPGGLRAVPGGIRFFRSKALNLIAVGNDTAKARIYAKDSAGKSIRKTIAGQPVWLLKPTVSIPARPFMRPGLKRAKTNPQVFAGFARGVNTALKAAGFRTRVVRA